MTARPNVWTIPSGAPFLDTLVDGILASRLVEGLSPADPFALADTTIYLPTRRAARAIRESFLSRLGRPLLLPRIRTLGDLDEDDADENTDVADLPPAIPAMERQLVLTQLVLCWSGELVRAAAELPKEELVVPASPADAARLAAALGRLIDQVGVDPAAWSGLHSEIPADLARLWQITLEFLKIVTEFWPRHLAERGLVDPGARRDALIRAEAERLARHGASAPMIAAGSTGSVPATAALLAAIARLPNGAVVLPGLDRDLDAAAWAAVGPSESEPAGAGHPQYGLKRLLGELDLKREDVPSLAAPSAPLRLRASFLSEAMRPAGTTESWSGVGALLPLEKAAALADVALLEAANEREEALAVAVILREALGHPDAMAALVTPYRGLARRVAVELQRWGIAVDDSAGFPLAISPPGVLARLTAEAALLGTAAETLLALLRHPLAAFGLSASDARWAAGALERAILRGPRLRPGSAALRHALELAAERRNCADLKERARLGTAARSVSRRGFEAARDLAQRLQAALLPLEALAGVRAAPLADLVAAHLAAVLAVARDPGGSSDAVFAGEAGEALGGFFEELTESACVGPPLQPKDYPGLFSALIERAVVRRRGGLDPRVHIWGALEARLQSVDTIVLGGLNEGTWPGRTRLDPLLSRPMRAMLDLEPPERRIGLAAHDFAQAMGQPKVWLTRADRENGEPRVASRWLQRLTAYAGETLTKSMRSRGDRALAYARRLDAPAAKDAALRPRPSPPVEDRPKKLSVTRIETLIRDPYAIYAGEILRLKVFEPLAKLPDAAERGMLVHDILEKFIRERPAGPYDAAADELLLAIGRAEFARHDDFPEVVTLWWPRFERIARWFVRHEAGRAGVAERRVEGKGQIEVTPDFTLTARADRLDWLTTGEIAIIDYKTGSAPGMDEVLALSPQLPLEGLIALRGGFDGLPGATPGEIAYYRLTGRGEGGEAQDRTYRAAKGARPEVTLKQTLATTERRLLALVEEFARPEAQYPSRKIPKRGRVYVGDYDHLARVAEWVASDEEGVDEWTP